VVRCILESLALKHAQTVELLAAVTGTSPTDLHIVGGGAHNELLCRWTADASGRRVHAGPEEATLIGNLLVQAMSLGEIASIADAREIVAASAAPTTYEPNETPAWREAREQFAAAVALPTLEVHV
jgi:rhamnulokinase